MIQLDMGEHDISPLIDLHGSDWDGLRGLSAHLGLFEDIRGYFIWSKELFG